MPFIPLAIIPFAAATAVATISIAAIVTQLVVGLVISLATSLIAKALMGKPKLPSIVDRGQTLSFRSTAAASQIVYGKTRVGGPIVLMGTSRLTTANDNKILFMAIALAGHEVGEIGDIYFADEVVAFDAESVVAANGFRAKAQGTRARDPGGGLGHGGGFAFVLRHNGTADQVADLNFRAALNGIPNIITAEDRFRGIAYLGVTLIFDQDKFPSGPPNISAVVKGRKVYDPRDGAHILADPSTWSWSENSALCVADYMRGAPIKDATGAVIRPYGVQAADASIDWAAVTVAANICDELVAVASGGTQKRYTCNGMIESDVAPEEGLKVLLSSMAGFIAWSGGQWKIFAGAYRTPVVTLGDDDQCGPAKTQAKRARRDLFNGIKGKFLGPATKYQATDFPSVSRAGFVSQDNGEEIWQDIELPFTDTASACQRIATIELQRNRQQIVTERRFKLSALGTQVGDTILLNDARKGWTAKPFEIARWSLAPGQDDQGQPFLAIDMVLNETASAVYDWVVGDESAFDPAPDTNLPRPWDVALPGAPGIFEELYSTRDGSGVKTRVTISWASAMEGYFLDYTVEYKLSSASEWNVLPATAGTTSILTDVAGGIYDFRVKTRNTLGVFSLYSTSTGLTVYGLGATPAALTGLGIQPLGNQAMLAWGQSVDLDVREGGVVEFRHSPQFSGATWENSTSIREAVPGAASATTVPLKAGTYAIRPVDSSGIAGPVATVSSKQASINGFTALSGSPLIEEALFAGTHVNTLPDVGILKLSGAMMWDDIADLDAAGTIDDLGGTSPSGTYTFAGAYDFGAVTNVRLTSKIEAVLVTALNGIDDRTANIDDWDDFDGPASGGSVDAWVEFRQTDDNPAGAPVWTAWMRLDTAEAACRAVQCRAQLRSIDPAYNINVSTLQVAAEART